MAHPHHARTNTAPVDVIDIDKLETNPLDSHEATSCDDYDDPTPDVHALFTHYNRKHFGSKLTNAYVEFSKRMTLCAGTCTFRGIGGCRIALSEPLLKLRPASDLRSTLLHEMIHALLFNEGVSRDGPDGHGPRFMEVAERINASEPPEVQVTPYHTFTSEVDHYRTHHWKCTSCSKLIKRAMNRPPGPYDMFWDKHSARCSGTFEKIHGPPQSKKSEKDSIPKRRVIAVKSNEVADKTQLPKDVVRTLRIDEMLESRASHRDPSVPCPVCNASVHKSRLNDHLDQCLLKDFTDDPEITEVPVVSQSRKASISSDRETISNNTAIIPPSPPFGTHRAPSTTNASVAVDVSDISISSAVSKVVRRPSHRSMNSHAKQCKTPEVEQIPREMAHDCQNEVQFVTFRRADEKRKVNSGLLVKLASDPHAVSDMECEEVIKDAESENTQNFTLQKEISFSELLRPLIVGESALERAQLARKRMNSRNFSNESGGSYVVPKHIVDLMSSPKAVPIQKQETESLIGNKTEHDYLPPKEKCRTIGPNEQVGLAFPERVQASKRPRLEKTKVPKPNNETALMETVKNTQQEMNNCPICDHFVPCAQIEAHVNTCLDNPDIKKEFCPSYSQDGRVDPSEANRHPPSRNAVPDASLCPICDKAIPRHQLAAHVDLCMKSAGLNDAF